MTGQTPEQPVLRITDDATAQEVAAVLVALALGRQPSGTGQSSTWRRGYGVRATRLAPALPPPDRDGWRTSLRPR